MDQSPLKNNLANFHNNNNNNYPSPNHNNNIDYENNENNNNYEEKKDYNYNNNSNSNDSNKKNTFGQTRTHDQEWAAYKKNPMGQMQNQNQNEYYENENINGSNFNNNKDKKEIRYLQETKSSRNLKRVFSGLVDRNIQNPRKSLEEIEEDQKKKKNAAEKCLSLYENGKIKNEVNRLLAEKNQKIKEDMELKECTFFPKTNMNEKIGDKNVNNQVMKKLESNFFDRISSWQQKKEKK